MLTKFQTIQQQQLAALGEQRNELNQQLSSGQHNLEQLHQYQQSLTMPGASFDVFTMTNRLSMQNQIVTMIDTVEQKIVLTQIDIARQGQLIKQQLGQIKGIDMVLDKRALAKLAEQELNEQTQQDELSVQSYLHRLV